MNVMVLFAEFIVKNFREDCFNFSDFASDFWYIWASNGNQGFLLDLIKAPNHLELRLDLYDNAAGVNPVVTRQFLNMSDLVISGDGMNVTMGPVSLTSSSCIGSVNQIDIDVLFSLSNRSNNFVPAWISKDFPEVPDFQSTYGTLSYAMVNGTSYQPNLPLVYSKYPVDFGLNYWKWCLMSIMSLTPTSSDSNEDQDPIQVEIAGILLADIWVVTSFVYYRGTVHHFDDPFLFETILTNHGEINGTERLFGATIKSDLAGVHFEIDCSAPTNKFAMLDRDGNTEIHTTVLGACTLTDMKRKGTYLSNSALLEAKQKITNTTSLFSVFNDLIH